MGRDDLGGRFLKGAAYVGGASWVAYALNLVLALVIARILGPETFGIYAYPLAIDGLIGIFTAFATGMAVVQAREAPPEFIDTAYAIAFGVALFGLLISSGVAAYFWHTGSTTTAWFLLALGLCRMMRDLSRIPAAKLNRELRYGVTATVTLVTRHPPNLVAIGLASMGWGAESLIVRDLLFTALPLCLYHIASGYWFRGRLDRAAFVQVVSFSGPLFLSRSVETLFARLDRFFVGTAFGETAVGLYHNARFVAETSIRASAPLTLVTFNLYSRLRDDRERLRRAHRIINYLMARILLCGAMTFFVYPEELLLLLVGSEWLGAAPVLQVLGIRAALGPMVQNMNQLLIARGLSLLVLRMRIFQLFVFVPGVMLSVAADTATGIAWSLAVATLLALVVVGYYTRDVVKGHVRAVFATPALAMLATYFVFQELEARQLALGIPLWLKVFLPPVFFATAVLAIERTRLLREFRYLRRQLAGVRRDAPLPPAAETPEDGN